MKTQTFKEYFLIQAEGDNDTEMQERILGFIQQDLIEPYHIDSGANDCKVSIQEIGINEVQQVQKKFICKIYVVE